MVALGQVDQVSVLRAEARVAQEQTRNFLGYATWIAPYDFDRALDSLESFRKWSTIYDTLSHM